MTAGKGDQHLKQKMAEQNKMNNDRKKTEFVTVCFLNFDKISKKLILTRLHSPSISIDLTNEPLDADVCLFNQEVPEEHNEISTLIGRLQEINVPLILLTASNDESDYEWVSTIVKPDKDLKLNEYLNLVNTVFYQSLEQRLGHKATQKSSKTIYNKHLSNAINPAQIQNEGNRYYAQKYVGLHPDIDYTNEEQLQKILLKPESYFFTYLRKGFKLSKTKNKIACVKTVYGTFYINAKDKIIFHNKKEDEIFNIHKIPFYKDTKVYIPKLKRKEINNLSQLYQFDYEPFVWLSSINASKGKIPQNTNINAPIKLLAWPDLSKLIVFKHAIRIISLWSRGVYSIKNTAQLLNIPQRYPLTVFTAMQALDLITEVKKR